MKLEHEFLKLVHNNIVIGIIEQGCTCDPKTSFTGRPFWEVTVGRALIMGSAKDVLFPGDGEANFSLAVDDRVVLKSLYLTRMKSSFQLEKSNTIVVEGMVFLTNAAPEL